MPGCGWRRNGSVNPPLEATQGQIHGFFCQLQYKCHQNRVASVGDWLKICPWVTSRVAHLCPLSTGMIGHEHDQPTVKVFNLAMEKNEMFVPLPSLEEDDSMLLEDPALLILVQGSEFRLEPQPLFDPGVGFRVQAWLGLRVQGAGETLFEGSRCWNETLVEGAGCWNPSPSLFLVVPLCSWQPYTSGSVPPQSWLRGLWWS